MNFDYTELTKSVHKDIVCYNYLEHAASYPSGIEKFYLKGVNNMEVFMNHNTSEIRLKANFPYFWQGHNFTFNKTKLIESIQFTSEMLNSNFFEAEVKAFEYGTILETVYSPEEILSNHISYNGKPLQPYYNKHKLTGKYFDNGTFVLKLYDAGRNMKNKLPEAIRSNLSSLQGYDKHKHYLKVENHYKKPQVHFKQRGIYVNELLSNSFMQSCKEDLINSYMNIMKTGIVKLPDNKKDLNVGTLPIIVLEELAAIYHFDTKDLLLKRLKSIPESKLSKDDKKARKRQLETNLNKIKFASQSDYDLTTLLKSKEIR